MSKVNAKRSVAVIVFIVLLGACGGSIGNMRSDVAERSWYEAKSKHFSLTTDLPKAKVVKRIAELEELWSAIAHNLVLIVPGYATPTQPMTIVHLASCDDFKSILSKERIAGFVTTLPDFDSKRTVVTCEDTPDRTQILLHELMHVFVRHLFSNVPPWLNEGLATYYQTIEVSKGNVVIGTFPSIDKRFWKRPSFLPSLRELLGYDYKKFQSAPDRRNYFASWKLVHLLNNSSKDFHQRFVHYLTSLGKGVSKEDAWTQAFGGIPHSKLSKKYKNYQQRSRLTLYTTPHRVQESASAPSVRPLRIGEIHATWSQLLMSQAGAKKNNAELLRGVRAQLALAEKQDPTWAGSLYWRAVFAYYFGNQVTESEDPLALLRQYTEKEPKDPRGHLGVLDVRMRSAVPDDYVGFDEVPQGLVDLEDDVRALVTVAEGPGQLHSIAWYYALRQLPMVGLNFARRSLEQDKGCSYCYDTLALMLFQQGKVEEAVKTQEKSINMLSDSSPPANMEKRLKHYKRALAQPAP